MKKKLITFISLISALILLFTACTQNETANGNSDIEDTSSSDTAAEKPTEQSGDTPYWKLQCRTIKEREDIHFDLGSNFDIALSFSKDWVLSAIDGGYDIKRDTKTIGSIVKGSAESAEWSVEKSYSKANNPSFSVKKIIEKKTSGDTTDYRYRFEYNCKTNGTPVILSMCIDYTELDGNAADRLYTSAKISSITTVQDKSLSDLDNKSSLILGNSFIGSSDIGTILDEMFTSNGKPCSFYAISQGYATVKTYATDPERLADIKSGHYKAVFICGFYSDDEADHLATLEKACKESNTKLIIFPAHNEFERSINAARNKCPTLDFLDWRGELEMLIDSGVNKWDLCVNDQHKHSTPLAGLVGAHMIYRAIYGEIPSLDGISSVNINNAKTILGDYLTTGHVDFDYEIIKFN